MSEFHLFPDMLDEHLDVMVRGYVADGEHSTAIMLACTCKRERARFKRLGFKWPLAAAAASAARAGYLALFKWLLDACHERDCYAGLRLPIITTISTFAMRLHWAAWETTNVNLFEFYCGPTYETAPPPSFAVLSWEVFIGFFAKHLTQKQIYQCLDKTIVYPVWTMRCLYYMYERYGQESLVKDFDCIKNALAWHATIDDIDRLELVACFNTGSRALGRLVHEALQRGNIVLLDGLFDRWEHNIRNCMALTHMVTVDNALAFSADLSVPMLEFCVRRTLPYSVKYVVALHILVHPAHFGHMVLTSNMRAIIAYAGVTLSDDVTTVREALPFIRTTPHDVCRELPAHITVTPGMDWVNAL